MSNLFWPGSERRGDQFTQEFFLESMVSVEAAWLAALVDVGIAPESARDRLLDLVGPPDIPAISLDAEAAGNPAVPLVALMRERLAVRNPDAARWLHRGLTSQDVVDSAVMILIREVVYRIRSEVRDQVDLLMRLADQHRATPMVARTLTQHAVPTTFGLKVALWLRGILEATDTRTTDRLCVQLGGAAGTMAATVELAGGPVVGVARALEVARRTAEILDLEWVPPWHTTRGAITALNDAGVRLVDAWGRIANDVLLLSRPEIGELSEGSPGGSSTMPHKRNPVLAAQIRRAALVVPGMSAAMHITAMESIDERAAGAWHAEWGILADIDRAVVVAAAQTTALLRDLQVHPDRMAATLAGSLPDVLSEQRTMAELVGRSPADDPRDYLGASEFLIDECLDRARSYLKASAVVHR
jgi:3-carboxy-cis,cis-muconate cycloisomerase